MLTSRALEGGLARVILVKNGGILTCHVYRCGRYRSVETSVVRLKNDKGESDLFFFFRVVSRLPKVIYRKGRAYTGRVG